MKGIDKLILILVVTLLSSCATMKFTLMVGPTGEIKGNQVTTLQYYKVE